MRKLFVLIAMFIAMLITSCDEAGNMLKPVIVNGQSHISQDILQWHRVPSRDITLQVPDMLVFYHQVDNSGAVYNPNDPTKRDRSLVLYRNYVISDDRIYVSDWSGLNIHAFDLSGNYIENEKMSRSSFSDGGDLVGGGSSYDLVDSEMVIGDDGTGLCIWQIVRWARGGYCCPRLHSVVKWRVGVGYESSRRVSEESSEYSIGLTYMLGDLHYWSSFWTGQLAFYLPSEHGWNNSTWDRTGEPENTVVVLETPEYILMEGNPVDGIRISDNAIEADRIIGGQTIVVDDYIFIDNMNVSQGTAGVGGFPTYVWTIKGDFVGRFTLEHQDYGEFGRMSYHKQSQTLYAWDTLAKNQNLGNIVGKWSGESYHTTPDGESVKTDVRNREVAAAPYAYVLRAFQR